MRTTIVLAAFAATLMAACAASKPNEDLILVRDCTTDADCDDGDPSTADVCTVSAVGTGMSPATVCAHAPATAAGCTSDVDCDDGDDSTVEMCRHGVCFVREVPPAPTPDAGVDAGTDSGPADAGTDAGSDAGVDSGAADAGSDASITEHGHITVRRDPSSPVGRQLAMGQTGIEVLRFQDEVGPQEDIETTRFVVVHAERLPCPTVRNLRLINVETGEQIGGTSPDSCPVGGGGLFDAFRLRTAANDTVIIKLVLDVNTFVDGASSGQRFRFGLTQATDDGSWDSPPVSIIATGVDSGHVLSATDFEFVTTSPFTGAGVFGEVYGHEFTIYRSVLTIAKAASSPSGISSGSAEQTVARFVVTNTSPGGYSARVLLMNLDIGSTIRTTADRVIRMYVDSVRDENRMATWVVPAGTFLSSTEWTAADFAGFDVDPVGGRGREVIITADTQDAATDQTLTVSIAADDLLWSDGVTAEIAECDSLPIAGNTLSY